MLSVGSLVSALAIHIAIFVGFAIYAVANGLFEKKEEIIPIDLSVVVVENFDGNDEEPPPLKKEQPPPPPPKPKSPPKPQPPKVEKKEEKALEKIVTNIVKKVEKKKDDDKKLPPQKTKEQLREERMKKMRESAKTVNKTTVIVRNAIAQPNGKTDKKTLSAAEIEKRLNEGYKPGRSTNIAASVEQFAYSLIKQTFEAKWDPPPWTDTLKPMVIRVWFGSGGRIIDSRIEKSSGDIRADQSLKVVASRVRAIPSLPEEFIKKYGRKGVPLSFTVKPN